MSPIRLLPFAALLLTGACAYDYAGGQAPSYPSGYDNGMGGGQYAQPGDQFGGQNVVSTQVFYEPLAQYGDWIDSRFGQAFRPDAPQGWRPYVNGQWGEDRLWISDDPWGWATDHYGRWGFDEAAGWVWVPGTEWAPSWVAWREDETQDVAGWAPIPPGVAYSVGVGFGSGGFGTGGLGTGGLGNSWGYDNWNSWYAPSWVWVPRQNIYQRGFGGRILPWNNGRNYWSGSRWNYNNGWNGRPGYNYGRPGYNRPGYPGNNPGAGRPDYPGRPGNYPRPGVSDSIGGAIAGVPRQRPSYPQGNYQGRPGGDRPAYVPRPNGQNYGQNNGVNNGVGNAIGGSFNGRPRPGYNGNPGRPVGAVGQPPRPAGQYQGGPGGGRPVMQAPAPQVSAPQPAAAPPLRAERPAQSIPRSERNNNDVRPQ
ncbi:hypothetical protein GCM10011529_02860 [Polymorphobacter glacialis]|uniref:BcpO-related WXXGXW repeat protein n=2 Tax=Sandarakinorhabdus glacialis TaxID=1614636 RepID=A0A916ZJ38_9SPHN|nr:hypothetical protein GCM10011529_02860 [Polymorphobacter glacialis]